MPGPVMFLSQFALSLYILLYLCYDSSMRKKAVERSDDTALEQPIYNRLAVLRTERGISRRQLADALGVNYQTIGYIERDEYNPSLELAFRLSEYFGLPIEAIFSRQPFRPLSEIVYGRQQEGES